MKEKIIILFLSISFLLVQNTFALPITVYLEDFEPGIDWSPWSDTSINGPNRGVTSNYHGNYTLNQGTTLTLTGLDAHTQLSLEFDLYLFHTWDGDNTEWGPDYFSLTGDINGSWTFATMQPPDQSYPGSPDFILHFSTTDPGTHVYLGLDPTGNGDEFLINHTADTFTLTFGGPTSQSDEWWGIDNVRVSIDAAPIPEPSTMLLLGVGLIGLAEATRRKLKK